jgi:nitrate/TMAO reductase-like tetraheme cytochrome c subunit
MRTVALQGYFSQSGVSGVTGNLGRHTVAAIKTVTGDTARRQVVDSAKCGNCHEWFEGHGGNRVYNIDVCATCHVPGLSSSGRQTRTDDSTTATSKCTLNGVVVPCTLENRLAIAGSTGKLTAAGYDEADPLSWPEASQNLKDLIHAIHGGEARGEESPLRFVRDRGNSGAFYYDFSEVTYPQREKSNCLACHIAGTYDAQLIDNALPSIQATVGVSFPADTRDEVLAARKATPNSTDFVSTPITATCTGCHTSELAAIHIEQNGGAISVQRQDVSEIETCTICHGPGRSADVTVIHPGL